jgi:hypothetical protein
LRFKRLHIDHITRNHIWDKTTLPWGAFATETPCTSIKDFYLMKDNFVCISAIAQMLCYGVQALYVLAGGVAATEFCLCRL